MGKQEVTPGLRGEQLRQFTRHLLDDVQALEQMLDSDCFETGVRRVGAEQELFLVDANGRPAPAAMEVLEHLDDRNATTELGRFNLEFNLDPLTYGGDCLRRMESAVNDGLSRVREAAHRCNADVVLVGILPTLTKADLSLENMTPLPRYKALDDALRDLRGGDYELQISGVDDLSVTHQSVMLEACNTSFQIHFQVAPAEFARLYNIAQAVTAPVLAAATNAPLLFGRRLWRETRIAVFQGSVDTRREIAHARQALARVSFGKDWVRESVLEIYREDIGRFKILLGLDEEIEDPFAVLEAGGTPRLQALQLHCGTIYRWNRACYGVTDGKPHLRIENRVLPSGPSPIDEVANAAFFFGLMSGFLETYDDITTKMSFHQVKANFAAAARTGLNAQFSWLDGKTIPAHELICEHLLPLAREGLAASKIDADDADRYLSVVEARVRTEQTGSQWLCHSLDSFGDHGTEGQRLSSLVTSLVARQEEGSPVHEWRLADLQWQDRWREEYQTVGQFMNTDIYTVNHDEPVDLVANLMVWNRLGHIPVEDRSHQLVGLVSARSLLRILAKRREENSDPIPVSAIMRRDPVFVTPETPTLEAIERMRREEVSCLPVVTDGKLVGLVAKDDFLQIAAQLIEEKLGTE